jgi:hypothetical protein
MRHTLSAHHLTLFGCPLDVADQLLLLGFELGALPVELALRFVQRAEGHVFSELVSIPLLRTPLMLSHALGWRLGPPEERLLGAS